MQFRAENPILEVMKQDFFNNQFLIAMPQQGDRIFDQALVYICEHNQNGAMGIIVNKTLPIELQALTKHLGLETSEEKHKQSYKDLVFFGGPCQSNHGFILHDGGLGWPSSIQVNPQLVMTSSKDILADIALFNGPENFLLALGYSGWSAGQLEEEMANNIWLNVPSDFDTIFSVPPEQRWQQAARSIGVNINLLGNQAGQA